MRSRRLAATVAAVGLAAASTRAARADTPAPAPGDGASADVQRARALYVEGDRHFKLAEYDLAIEKFKEAYRLAPVAGLLYNLAQAYRLKGDCRQALWFYDKFAHSDATAAAIEQAEAPRADARSCAERQDAEAAAAAAAAPAEPERGAPVAAPPAPAETPARRPRSWKTWTGVGVGVGGLALLATGGYFGLDAQDQARQRDAACNDGDGCDAATARAFDAAGESAERRAVVLMAVGGAALAGGVTLYLLGRQDTGLTVTPTEGGATVALRWSH